MEFETLIKDHFQYIERQCSFMSLKYKIDSEELKSRVLEKTWKSRKTYIKQEDCKFATWLGYIITSMCNDMWRENNKRYKSTFQHISLMTVINDGDSELLEYLPVTSTEKDVENREKVLQILLYIRNIYKGEKNRQRRITFYMKMQGYKLEEIAEHFNTNINTVKTHIHFAKKQLL